MSRNHLHGALIALFPILVCIATDFIASATHGAPANCLIAICLLILTVAIRMGGQKLPVPALSPRERRESRRQARLR